MHVLPGGADAADVAGVESQVPGGTEDERAGGLAEAMSSQARVEGVRRAARPEESSARSA